MEETKIDRILSQVLTMQGQITIMQGQMNKRFESMQKQIDKRFDNMQEQMDKRFRKVEIDHEEFKKELGQILQLMFKQRDKRISKNSKEIKKLQRGITLKDYIRIKLNKITSKIS